MASEVDTRVLPSSLLNELVDLLLRHLVHGIGLRFYPERYGSALALEGWLGEGEEY
jgi:hypothetical protein